MRAYQRKAQMMRLRQRARNARAYRPNFVFCTGHSSFDFERDELERRFFAGNSHEDIQAFANQIMVQMAIPARLLS